MNDEQTPKDIITQHLQDYTNITQELLAEGPLTETQGLIEDLKWQIRSIEAGLECPGLDEYSVAWILGEGFLKCPLRTTQQPNEEGLCVEVDCPQFNRCELTTGILDKYARDDV